MGAPLPSARLTPGWHGPGCREPCLPAAAGPAWVGEPAGTNPGSSSPSLYANRASPWADFTVLPESPPRCTRATRGVGLACPGAWWRSRCLPAPCSSTAWDRCSRRTVSGDPAGSPSPPPAEPSHGSSFVLSRVSACDEPPCWRSGSLPTDCAREVTVTGGRGASAPPSRRSAPVLRALGQGVSSSPALLWHGRGLAPVRQQKRMSLVTLGGGSV